MMKIENKIAVFILILGLFILSIYTIKFYADATHYKQQSETEMLRLDSTMAVKQLLDKEIFILEKKFDSLLKTNKKGIENR